MSQADYRAVRGKLVAREKQCKRTIKQILRRHRDFIPTGVFPPDDDDVNTMVGQIIAASSMAQHRSQQRGFDGYKYAIMTTQIKYSKGFSSKGKKYAARIFLVTALELFLYLVKAEGERGALTTIEIAAQGNITSAPIHADSLARIWMWDREFHNQYAVWASLILDGLSGATLHKTHPWADYTGPSTHDQNDYRYTYGSSGEQRQRRRQERQWRREYEGSYIPPTTRPDNWAYGGEVALNKPKELIWYEVLQCKPTDPKHVVERAYKAQMWKVHPNFAIDDGDRLRRTEMSQQAVAAWRVAQKVNQYRW